MTTPGGGRQVKIIISADVAQAIRSLGQVEQGLGGVAGGAEQAQKKTSTMGDVMKGTLAASGIEAGLGGIVSGFKSVVSGGLEYESSLNTFAAVTKRAGESTADVDARMQQMAETAKSLGADIKIPGASAQSAAAAMTELAKGGLSADEAMSAARGTMILAAAASIDGAQAAEIQANALQTFGLKADQAGRVANVLANVANQSSGEITDFSQALAQSGAVANMMGLSIEDTATALGLFANAGLKGSDAGTSLKTSMTALLNPSRQSLAAIGELGLVVKDSEGNFVGYRSIVEQLTAAKGRMTQMDFNSAAAQVLGTDAVRAGAIVAAGGTAAWDDMAAALNNTTGAQDVAAANSKGLTGVIDALKNTVDTASLSLFETLQPSIMKVAEAATGLVGPLAEGLAPALGSVADLATGTLAPAIGTLTGVITAIAGPVAGLAGWIGDLPGPIGAAVLALGGVILLRGPLTATFATWTASGATLLATLRGSAGAAVAGSAGLAGWIASLRAATGAAATFGVIARGALSVLGGSIGIAIVGAATALSFFSSSTDDATVSTAGLSAAIDENTGLLTSNADAIIAKAAADSGSFDAIEAVGGSVKDYTAALMGNADAQDTINTLLLDQAEAALKATGGWEQISGMGTGAREIASSMLAAGDAGAYTSEKFEAVLAASKHFAADSDALSTSQRQTGQAIEAAGTAAGTAAGEVDTLGGATEDAEKSATPFGDALKEIRSAASEADAAAQFLSITLLQMSGNSVPAEQAARAHAAAFREVGNATRDIGDAADSVAEKQEKLDELTAHLGTTLNGQAESATNAAVTQRDVDAAARDLADAQSAAAAAADKQKDALDKAAQSSRDMTAEAYNGKAAQGDLRGGIEAAVAKMVEQRAQFIGSAVDAGIGQEAAEALANAQGLIPDNVRTTYEQIAVDDAIKKADDLNRKLSELDKKEIYYKVVGTEVQKFVTGSYAPEDLHAEGGYISGPGTGTSDSIRARLSNGEFVVRASQTAKHRDVLEAINTPGFADGGMVSTKHTGDFSKSDLGKGFGPMVDGFIGKIREAMAAAGAGVRNAFLQAILSKQGTSYVWGAAGPDVFDCSGLMSWGLQQAGVGKGRLTAEGFNSGFPSTTNPRPGDMVTFDTGRLPGRAGHIGAVLDPAAQTMMHTDGAGPARVQGYKGRPGFLRFVNVIGSSAPAGGAGGPNGAAGDLPAPGGRATAGVAQWVDEVLTALRITGQPASYSAYVLRQMMTESSGNQFAVNNFDSNSRRGTPSKGLMQVIDPTFRSYALSGYDSNIFDPMSNIIASIRYVLARYGSIPAGMQGRAYDNGGALPPGFTMAYNGTGQTEHVMTAGQKQAMDFAAGMGGGYAPVINVTNYVDAAGILSRTEVMVDGKLSEVRRVLTVSGAQT